MLIVLVIIYVLLVDGFFKIARPEIALEFVICSFFLRADPAELVDPRRIQRAIRWLQVYCY